MNPFRRQPRENPEGPRLTFDPRHGWIDHEAERQEAIAAGFAAQHRAAEREARRSDAAATAEFYRPGSTDLRDYPQFLQGDKGGQQ